MSYNDFWEYTFNEVGLILKVQESVIRQKNADIYNQAYLIASLTTSFLGGGNIMSFEEAFGYHAEEKPASNAYIKEMFLDYANE